MLVVLQQLLSVLYTKTILNPFQSGFRPNYSVETALLRVTNDLLLARDSGQNMVLTLIDISAAFDTLDFDILLRTLRTHCGISGLALTWFESYLKIGDKRSKFMMFLVTT